MIATLNQNDVIVKRFGDIYFGPLMAVNRDGDSHSSRAALPAMTIISEGFAIVEPERARSGRPQVGQSKSVLSMNSRSGVQTQDSRLFLRNFFSTGIASIVSLFRYSQYIPRGLGSLV